MQDTARRRLEAEVADLRRSAVAASARLVVGPAATGVLEAAEEERADLLVAGTRGRTGWKRVLLGSTAEHLVRDARCPVLTIHPTDAGAPRPLRKVLVATDFSDEAAAAAAAASALGSPEVPQHLVVLHVYRLPNEALHLPAQLLADAIHETRDRALGRLEQEVARLARPGASVTFVAREGNPAELILEHAREVGADLIALGTHGRSGLDRLFLGSTAERVLPSASCPVLTVRRPAAA